MNARTRTRALLLAIAGIAGAGAGWLYSGQMVQEDAAAAYPATAAPSGELIGSPRPDFSLGGTNGEIIRAADFDGQVLLVNFWATWCAPCREEMPMLAELDAQLAPEGFRVVGIALDDVAQARDFIESLGIEYPVMVGGADVMAVSQAYGNRTGLLPYSVLVDREGRIRWARMGVLEEAELDERIRELL